MLEAIKEVADSIAKSGSVKANHNSLGAFAYYVAFGLYVFVYGLSRTLFTSFLFLSADAIIDVGRIVCVLLLIMKLFTQHYSRRQLFGLVAVGAITIATLYTTKDWNIVLLFFFIVAGQGISVRKLAAIAMPIQLAMLLLTSGFAAAGVIESRFVYRSVDGVMQLRSSMGYAHPNSFGQSVLSVCCSIAILRLPKFNLVDLLIYIIGIAMCNTYADSRTSMVCIAFVALLALAFRVFSGRKSMKWLSVIAAIAAFGAVCFSFFMMLFYDPSVPWMNGLNSVLSARFSLAHSYYTNYPLKPFGYESQSVAVIINAYYTQYGPDNAYVRMLILNGVLPAAIFITLYLLTFLRFAKQRRFDVCVFGLFIFAIAAIMESYSLAFAANYCLVGTTCLIYGWGQYLEANPEIQLPPVVIRKKTKKQFREMVREAR